MFDRIDFERIDSSLTVGAFCPCAARGIQRRLGGAAKALVACVAVAFAFAAFATQELKNYVTWTYSDDSVSATIESIPIDAEGDEGALNVPPELGGFPVTTIGASAFANCSLINYAFIPSSVTSIGAGAFEGCASLADIDITGIALTVIPDRMFKGCVALKRVTWNIDSLDSIGSEAFRGCTALERLTLPVNVTTIGSGAFSFCPALKEVTMPKTVTSIGIGAFLESGLKTVYVSEGKTDSVRTLLEGSGLDVSGVEIVEISDVKAYPDPKTPAITWHYRTIGEVAEIYNDGSPAIDPPDYFGPVTVPASINGHVVTRIGDRAFAAGCTSLTGVSIPESVTSIGESAFLGCTGLMGVSIPDSVTVIGSDAFRDCDALAEVSIGKGVTRIGDGAFNHCVGLTGISIPDSVTTIGDYAFENCNGLTEVTIGKGVTNIGSYAFSGSSLVDVAIPSNMTSIGFSAFSYCASLKRIAIPDGVTSIEGETFLCCAALETVTIGTGVTRIGGQAFSGCAVLKGVEIPDGVTSIGAEAFDGCAALTSVTIPSAVSVIANGVFRDCVSLERVDMPYGLTLIGSSAFEGCAVLTDMAIPPLVASVGDRAFFGCAALTGVELPEGVLSIEPETFSGCAALTIATIPGSMTVIGTDAFAGCAALEDVVIPSGVTSIGARAFKNCTSLTSAAIPSSMVHIGEDAFKNTLLNTVFVEDMVAESAITILLSSEALYDTSLIVNWVRADEKAPHAVTFVTYVGKSPVSHKTVYDGYAVGALPVATRAGYAWQGWFTDPEGGTKITEATVVTGDVTCYAQWLAEGCARETFGGIEWTYRIVDGHAEICNGDDPAIPTTMSGAVVIPEKLGGDKPVTVIGACALQYCASLKSVKIPEGVTSIEECAFAGCSSLTSVSIPESVTSIGYQAFADCDVLADVKLPGGTTSIGDEAFLNCHALEDVTIPGGVTAIGNGAFNGCNALASVTIREGVTSIGECAFKSCMTLAEVTIPGSVTNIGDEAFNNCTSLASVTMQEGLTDIGAKAFLGCSVLTEVTIPDSVTSIGEEAFKGCLALAKVTMPIALKGAFDDSVFEDCNAEIFYHAIFTVTFNPNGGTVGEATREIDNGSPKIGTLPEPMWTGYDFDGWYTTDGDLVSPATVVSANVTYYAHWRPKKVSVKFDANGGDGGTVETLEYGTPLTPPTVTWEGHVFDGWSPEVPTTVPAENATYVAQWKLAPVSPDSGTSGEGGGPGGGQGTPGEGGGPGGEQGTPATVKPCYVVLNASDVIAPYLVPKAVTLQGVAYAGCDVVGIVELKLGKVNDKKKTGKVSGSFVGLDGKKLTIKATPVSGIDGLSPVTVSLEVKNLGTMTVTIGGTKFAGSLGDWHVQSADVGGDWAKATATVTVGAGNLSMFAGQVRTNLLPQDETASASGGKWTFAKAAIVKWAKPKKGAPLPEIYDAEAEKGLVVDTSGGKTNRSGLKLAYVPKKGTFKGSFKVYALEGTGKATKLKKYTVNVTGVVAGGVGYGVATSKKPVASWPVTVR